MKTGWLFDQIQELFAHAHGLTTSDVPYPLRSLIEREYERLDPRNILDIGCRSSRYALPGYDYLGIDPNSDHVTYCRRKRAGRFEEMSAGHLDVADKTFDVVLCLSVAHHLPNDSLRRVCSEIKRVLRNDGVLISAEPVWPVVRWKLAAGLPECLDEGRWFRYEQDYIDMLGSEFLIEQRRTITDQFSQTLLLLCCKKASHATG